MASQATLIEILRTDYNLNAVPASEFYGHATTGVWIRDDICKPETEYYPYAEGTLQDNKLNRDLEAMGWFPEPYDSETIMIYPI